MVWPGNLPESWIWANISHLKELEEILDWQFKQAGTSLEEMQRIGVKTFDREYDDLYFAEDEQIEFPTDSGKIELYSTDFEAAGFDPLPRYVPHEEPSDGFYRLIYGRAPMHTFGRTSNNPNLHDLMSRKCRMDQSKSCERMGIKTDQ